MTFDPVALTIVLSAIAFGVGFLLGMMVMGEMMKRHLESKRD